MIHWLANKTSLGGVDEYYNTSIDMVSSNILEYGRPGEVFNNYTIGSGSDAKPERHKFDFTISLIRYWEVKM